MNDRDKNKKYLELLTLRRTEYKSYSAPYCLALREYVSFNSDGFNHLRFRTDGTPRKQTEQMYKLGLLPLVIPVIHLAMRVDQYERRLAPIGRKKKDNRTVIKEVEYWALVAVVGKQSAKLRVILRKVGDGKLHFWSVMKLGENPKNHQKIKSPLNKEGDL